ncbi:MAG: hypothetical protein WCX64_05435 [Candidatus Micrarchaeia archaeon]
MRYDRGKSEAGRGFVATFVTCTLAALILMLIAFSQPSLSLRDRYLADYSGSAVVRQLFDNAAVQVGAISGINSSFTPRFDGNVTSAFSVALLSASPSSALSSYSSYLQDNFSQAASAVIVPSFGPIASGHVDLMSNTTDFFVDYNTNSIGFAASPGSAGTGFSNLSIALVIPDALNESTPWAYDESGDVNVTLSVTAANVTTISNGRMSSSTPHYYLLNVTSGAGGRSVMVYFGNSGAGNGGLQVASSSVNGTFSANATIPYALSSLWYYNATLNVTKAAIARNSKLMVWEGG